VAALSAGDAPNAGPAAAAAGPLAGIRVLDVATIFAGPLAATLLGDFGADVIKIEHPRGDPLRHHGPVKDGHGLWWKSASRNKRCVTLNLSTSNGQDLFRSLAKSADVVVENFRPGVMERWSLGYETLAAENPGLVMLRVTGFGQFGPYAHRPGFGTLAEAMSGFAHITGEAEGPPTLPPFGLADGISGLTGAYAVMCALYARDARGGRGQYIDLAIIEPIVTILGAQATGYDQLGIVQGRIGNQTPNNAPRNTYRTSDGRWIAISTSTNAIAERVMRLVGRPDFVDEPWFTSSAERAAHGDELDAAVAAWIADRSEKDVIAAFEQVGAAIAPIYDIERTLADPQYQALNTFPIIDDEDLGPLRINGLMFRMSQTPGSIAFAGRRLGQDNAEVYTALGLSAEELASLKTEGVI
jgi:crotonobetainyl-CoA:carnitine CoA-transferase CaiB-like acyl-CoA transferase